MHWVQVAAGRVIDLAALPVALDAVPAGLAPLFGLGSSWDRRWPSGPHTRPFRARRAPSMTANIWERIHEASHPDPSDETAARPYCLTN